MIRVLLVTNILSPYRVPLLNAVAEPGQIDLEVALLAANEPGREWKVDDRNQRFRSRVLPGLHGFLASREFHVHINWGLGSVIRRFRPHVIVTSGYDNVGYWKAMLYAALLRKPLVLLFESTPLSAEYTSGPVAILKRFFVRRAAAYVPMGSKAREWLVALGARPARVFEGINTVDMDWYREAWQSVRGAEALQSERARYPKVLFLFVGQLIERKNLKRTLKALASLQDPEIGVLLVGSGPQEAELRDWCSCRGLRNVYFEGFQHQPALPRFYALADVLILPSIKEVWGLVVNEALAAGLYVLCSERAGAGYDLLQDGWNGRLFDPYDVAALARLMRETKQHIDELRARREAISEHACREFGIEGLAKAFRGAIRSVTERGPLSPPADSV